MLELEGALEGMSGAETSATGVLGSLGGVVDIVVVSVSVLLEGVAGDMLVES